VTSRFIVLDGVEGCGKSTQIRRLSEYLTASGYTVTQTVEPGGTPVGLKVRELLLDPAYSEMTPLTELMLFCASRAQHCDEVIRPALDAGNIVLCDRFASATVVYQGYAGGLDVATIETVNHIATRGLQPDLLIVLDIDPGIGMTRKLGAGMTADRIEEKSLEFHRKVRDGFLTYAQAHSDFAVVVDADRDPDVVFTDLKKLVACEA